MTISKKWDRIERRPPVKPYVLLVDDNDDATFFLTRLLRKAGVDDAVESVADGDEAIRFLRERLSAREFLPLFVCLDLKMPKMDGFDVLRWVRSREELEELVVIVVSSSDEESDLEHAFSLGADCYLLKHPEPRALTHIHDIAKEIGARRRRRAESRTALTRDCVRQRRVSGDALRSVFHEPQADH